MAGYEPSSWSEEIAAELGQRALAAVGLTATELTTLKFGTIANFKVEDPPLFLKVADPRFRSAEPVLERSLQLSAWLEGNGFPVTGAAEEAAARPVAVEGAWAGIWRWQDHRHARPDPARVGQLLRRLHELLARCPVGLPEVDHFEAGRRHAVALGQKGHLEEEAVGFVLGQADRIGGDWDEFESELGVGAIHGDFEVNNILSTDRGPVLIDLDNAQIAPRDGTSSRPRRARRADGRRRNGRTSPPATAMTSGRLPGARSCARSAICARSSGCSARRATRTGSRAADGSSPSGSPLRRSAASSSTGQRSEDPSSRQPFRGAR